MARSYADRLRSHREEMLLAMELGCTPREARIEIDRRASEAKAQSELQAARARWDRTERRLLAKVTAPIAPAVTAECPKPDYWWDRD